MAMSEMFLMELEHEAEMTRKALSRIPADNLDWRPHEKSFTIREMASHLADLAGWAVPTITLDVLNFADPNMAWNRALESKQAILDKFEANVIATREALTSASDETLLAPWTMKNGDVVYFTLPRVAVLRSFFFNHTIHHRAQLGLYLRLNDIPVPAIYGPTADEGMM